MSLIAKATKDCLTRLTRDAEGEWSAVFVFPSDYIGFKGHFPDNPVLPGVCIVEAVLGVLAAAGCDPVRLTRVVSAKWFVIARPCEELRFNVCLSGGERAERTVKARVSREGQKIAELSLAVTLADSASGAS